VRSRKYMRTRGADEGSRLAISGRRRRGSRTIRGTRRSGFVSRSASSRRTTGRFRPRVAAPRTSSAKRSFPKRPCSPATRSWAHGSRGGPAVASASRSGSCSRMPRAAARSFITTRRRTNSGSPMQSWRVALRGSRSRSERVAAMRRPAFRAGRNLRRSVGSA
jgi:hypothetical protein